VEGVDWMHLTEDMNQ